MQYENNYWYNHIRTGMDLLGRGVRGVLFFMIKQKIIRDKMRYSNLSNNMMINEL